MVKNTMPAPEPHEWEFIPRRPFDVLEDHWEYPGLKRVEVSYGVREWIEQHDKVDWQGGDIKLVKGWYRFEISPRLLTLLKLKWS